MVSAVWMWCVWSLLAVAAAGVRLSDPATLLDDRHRDGAMRMHGQAPVNVSQLNPCSYITNPADLFGCRTAGVVEFKDCSKMDQNTVIAAPFLTSVTGFRLKCTALMLYLPRLATVTGTVSGGYSIDLQAWVQYVYLFSLNSVAGFLNVGVRAFAFPCVGRHRCGSWNRRPKSSRRPTCSTQMLAHNPFFSSRVMNVSSSSTVALHADELCGADKTLTSAQIAALKQSCAVGNVHWDSLEGVESWKLAEITDHCEATSIRSASFANVKRSDRIRALECDHVDYVGDSSIANPGPVLFFQNSVLEMQLSYSRRLYGGIYMVASSIRLGFQEAVAMHGARSYQTQPDANPIIPVPDPRNYQQMTRCRLTTAGQFVPFSDGTLADCGMF